jgi:dihydrofolate reductase
LSPTRGDSPMRKVVVYELLSLAGIAEQPDEFITDFDEIMRENLGRVITSQDAVLLGRRTYDDWAGFWPNSDIEPFASFINGVQKFVVTSTPLEPRWASSSVVGNGLAQFVADLKHQPGGDIGVHGSISLAQSSLVDELRLVIAPAVHTQGRRLFDHGEPQAAVTDPQHHLPNRLPAGRLPGEELTSNSPVRRPLASQRRLPGRDRIGDDPMARASETSQNADEREAKPGVGRLSLRLEAHLAPPSMCFRGAKGRSVCIPGAM